MFDKNSAFVSSVVERDGCFVRIIIGNDVSANCSVVILHGFQIAWLCVPLCCLLVLIAMRLVFYGCA